MVELGFFEGGGAVDYAAGGGEVYYCDALGGEGAEGGVVETFGAEDCDCGYCKVGD